MAAVALLSRAVALHPEAGPARWSLKFDLADGLTRPGPLPDAVQLAEALLAAAVLAGDGQWAGRSRVILAFLRLYTEPEAAIEALQFWLGPG